MSHRDGTSQHDIDGNGASQHHVGGNGHDTLPAQRRTPNVVQEMVRRDRADHPDRTAAGSTASADAVESVRLALRDLKHDVRMLKVGMDKQQHLLEYLTTLLERLARDDRKG